MWLLNLLRQVRSFFHAVPIRRNDSEAENQRRLGDPVYLERFGFKVYSQNDEDGYIEEIFNRIGTTDKKFIEFGVQDGLESNCHYLLHKGWSGLWIEGSKKCFKQLRKKFEKPIKTKQLTALNTFITADNINSIIKNSGILEGGG